MRKIIYLLIGVVTMMMVACEKEETPIEDNTIDVIVMAGQSNMEGHSWSYKLFENTNSSMHPYYTNGFEKTKMMFHSDRGTNKSEIFSPVKLGQGYDTTRFGPEVGIAEELHNRGIEKDVYLIKYALGGTSLYEDWNVDDVNSLYHEMVSYIYDQLVTLEEAGYKVKIKAFLWMQGEADAAEAVTATEASKYYDNLNKLVSSFRTEFEEYYGVEERGIAFVDAGISDYQVYKFHTVINSAKETFASEEPEKNYYIDTMALGLEYNKDNTDYYHFDATSELKLGKEFVSILLDNGWL